LFTPWLSGQGVHDRASKEPLQGRPCCVRSKRIHTRCRISTRDTAVNIHYIIIYMLYVIMIEYIYRSVNEECSVNALISFGAPPLLSSGVYSVWKDACPNIARRICIGLHTKSRYSQCTRIGHVPGEGRPLLWEGGPISYETRPSVCFLPTFQSTAVHKNPAS